MIIEYNYSIFYNQWYYNIHTFNISFKLRFYQIVNGIVELKGKNSFYLTKEKYNVFILSEVKEAKSVNVKNS